jgi:predicted NACHT family NTPase
MQDLNRDEQRTFLEKWFFAAYRNDQRALHPEKPDDLEDLRQQALDAANTILEFVHREENRSLRFMAGSPVLLQIIAIIWKERGNLSTERAALYHRCTQFLLDHRDRAKGIDPLMRAEKARRRPLALWMQEELRKDEAPTAELVRRLAQPLQEIDPSLTPQKFLENLRDRAGLLQTFGDEAYIFRHKSFREYLASAELAWQSRSQPQRLQVFVENFDDNWWREPIVFAAGFAEPLIFSGIDGSVVKKRQERQLEFVVALAARG